MFNLGIFGRTPSVKDLYDRQMRIQGLDQELLGRSKVGVIGVGATGSHSAVFLAHIGVGFIRLCDFDDIEIHNIPRMLGTTLKDVGRNKADAVANFLRKLGNGTNLKAYKTEAKHLPEKFFKGLDAAIICVDRISARFETGEMLWSRRIPHVDVGIREFLLNVIEILPGREGWPCMFCMKQVIPEEQLKYSNRAQSCNEKPIPTILPPAAMASSIAVNEVLKIITDFELGTPLDNFMQFDLRGLIPLKLKIPKKEDCLICGTGQLA